MSTRGSQTLPTGETCKNGQPILKHQSWVETAQGGFWRTDYKSCCPEECVNADQPGI